MESRPYLIVSDVHLGAVPLSTERSFRGFLDFAKAESSGLLVNGDLFDFWFEYRSVILREHFRVVAKLAEVVEAGVPISFIGGNHDAWAGSFLRDEVGIRLMEGPMEMELAGRRVLIAHGDGVGGGDLRYRALKAVIRSPVSIAAFRTLHPDMGSRIAKLASSTEHKAERTEEESRGRARFLQAWSAARLQADSALDLVLTGHAHYPWVEEFAPGRYHANSGDWIRHFTYLALPPGGGPPELHRWPATG